ncbi:MAG: hypothetical protein DIU71_01555 [Proteobacteria bacterium]|nr:MAG: hypothetical protein DIU71_01555 [Pseudomonadota bacterium]
MIAQGSGCRGVFGQDSSSTVIPFWLPCALSYAEIRKIVVEVPGGLESSMCSARHILRGAVAVLAGGAWLLQALPSAHAADTALQKSPGQGHSQWDFLEEHCIECHNAADWAGGLAFDIMDETQIAEYAEDLEESVRKLRGRLMPPADKPQPDAESLRAFVSWMEGNLDAVARERPEPGRVGLHRLNRKEYANAVRDLLALEIDPVALLPRDDSEDGFDNIADALQVSPSFLDQYLAAARTVAIQAIGNPSALPAGVPYAVRGGTQQFYREGMPLGTRGGMAVDHYFPADGEYEINIANMAQALWVYNMEFEHTVIVTLDGAEVYRTKIGGEEDMKAIDQEQDPAVDAINQRLKNIRFRAPAGYHKVAVGFIHRTFAESEDRLASHIPGGGQDRVLRVSSFEIRGPFDVTGVSQTPSRQRIFSCYPETPAEEQPCAEQIVTKLARRAFRRPLSDADVQGLMHFYRRASQTDGFEAGIRQALTAILASPDFLFRAEVDVERYPPGSIQPISDLDLASRLSFFLWSSVPDDELLELAATGKLRDPDVLAAQVRRLLADERADSLVTDFAFQWLNIDKLDEIEPDARMFPYASGAGDLRTEFRRELELFIGSIFREDRSVVELLTADHTYLNERLALHYGIRDVKGDVFRRVQLADSTRYGLLGKGATLMLTSYPNRTAPVLRGAWILERITGTPPAPPPPNVESLKENQEGEQFKTIRELMAAHSTDPNCHSCHGVMDALGFALENFDATGRWRDIDRYAGAAIDSSGKLPDGTELAGPDDLRMALTANPDQFVQTLTEKLLAYALGRTVEYYDMPTVREIVRKSAEHDYRFSSLIMNIVMSDAFQKRRIPEDAGHGAAGERPLLTQAARGDRVH